MPLTDSDRELLETVRTLVEAPPDQDWQIAPHAMHCRRELPRLLALTDRLIDGMDCMSRLNDRLLRDAEELAAIKAVWRGDHDE